MKSPIAKIVIKIVITVASIAAIFYFLIFPKLNILAENQIALEKVSSEYRQAYSKLADLNKLNKSQSDLEATKKTVYTYLPDEPSASSFIVSLEQMTSQIPVIIESLSVNEVKSQATSPSKTSDDSDTTSKSSTGTSSSTTKTATKNAEKALGFTASFKSDYSNILTFFRQMEQMDRFNTIESVVLGGLDSKTSTLNLQASGKIYYAK